MRKWPPRRWKRSIPRCRSSLCGPLIPTRPPTLWKRWTPMPPPTCWATCPRKRQKRSWKRWSRKSARKSQSCWPSMRTAPPARMTTDYIALSPEHTVGDAIDRLRSFEGPVETISSIYLVDAQEKLVGSVPLVSLVLASGGTRLGAITPDHVIYVEANASDKDVAEMFDKYNLL